MVLDPGLIGVERGDCGGCDSGMLLICQWHRGGYGSVPCMNSMHAHLRKGVCGRDCAEEFRGLAATVSECGIEP